MVYKRIALIFLACIMFISVIIVMNREKNEVIYQNYVAESNENNIVYTLSDESISLSLRWMNKGITEGPYSLFLAVNVQDDRIEELYIENLHISSSGESIYQFRSVMSDSLLIYNVHNKEPYLKYDKDNKKIGYYQFDDKFAFKFEENEEIMLTFKLRYKGKNLDIVKNVQVKYKPYSEVVHAPIK